MTEKKERPAGNGPNQILSNAGTNIDDQFIYSCESAKFEFQANISSLLELHSELTSRITSAHQKNKPGVYLLNSEMEVFNDWLLQTSMALLENYALIDRTLRKTQILYKVATRIHLKDLVA